MFYKPSLTQQKFNNPLYFLIIHLIFLKTLHTPIFLCVQDIVVVGQFGENVEHLLHSQVSHDVIPYEQPGRWGWSNPSKSKVPSLNDTPCGVHSLNCSLALSEDCSLPQHLLHWGPLYPCSPAINTQSSSALAKWFVYAPLWFKLLHHVSKSYEQVV